jgi:hypothetical protein
VADPEKPEESRGDILIQGIMKKSKKWLSLVFVFSMLYFSPSSLFALSDCTQSESPCQNGPGLQLTCGGPVTSTACYSGGCGAPVTRVYCTDDPQQ